MTAIAKSPQRRIDFEPSRTWRVRAFLMNSAGFARDLFERYLLEELRRNFPNVQLSTMTASNPDGTAEWVIDVREPVACRKIFRPHLKGKGARAKICAAELASLIASALHPMGSDFDQEGVWTAV